MYMRNFLLLAAGAMLAQAQQYSITTFAGGAPPPTPASATATPIGQPRRTAVDSAGNVYFTSGHSVFKMTGGTLTLVAGNSRPGYSGDGGPAVKAQLNTPQGLALDGAGNLYIADSANNRVRMVTTAGVIRTFAGNGSVSPGGGPSIYGDEGAATDANLHLPMGLAVDSSGTVYIADTGDNMIRNVTTDGIIHRFAGDSFPGYFGESGTATSAEFHTPSDVLVDSKGNVYVADTSNAVVRQITTDGIIHLFAGKLATGSTGDGGAATSATLTAPMALAMDSSGNLFILDNGASKVRKVDTKGVITTVAGNGTAGLIGDGGNPINASLNFPTGIAVDGSGNVYVADFLNLRIRKISGSTISSVAGNGLLAYSGDNGQATSAQLNAPQGLVADRGGNVFIADTGNDTIRQVGRNGVITTFVGSGGPGSGTNELNAPQGVAEDASGNIYITDTLNARVQKVVGSSISTLVGNGSFYTPVGGAVDAAGNVYVADLNSNVVRKVSPSGDVSTAAGTGSAGFSGDGNAAASAQLNAPQAVAVDAAGNLYIADTGNRRIRKVTTDGRISTIAGNGLPGFSGDGGPATLAQIGAAAGVAVDTAGNVYVSDGTSRVRKVNAVGFIFTIAGNGTQGYSGDGGSATVAQLNGPTALAVDAAGNVYVADTQNNAVRVLAAQASTISIGAVTNAASNLTGPIGPGELITIYGSGLGPAGLVTFQLNSFGLVPTSVGGTSVFINGAAVPVLYAMSAQVGAVAPFGLSGSNAQVVVAYQGQTSAAASVRVEAAAPGVFQLGPGQIVALNQDGTVNGADHPAPAGSYLTVYATGAGQTNPPGQDGAIGAPPLGLPNFSVTVTIGGKSADVQFAGAAPGLVQGVIQVNALVPSGLTAGPVPMVVAVGGANSQSGVVVYVAGDQGSALAATDPRTSKPLVQR
jgi:uncharacterized protein (TIGR03437 family)